MPNPGTSDPQSRREGKSQGKKKGRKEMNIEYPTSPFQAEWSQFIDNLAFVCERKVKEKGDRNYLPLLELLGQVITDIKSDQGQNEISSVIAELSEEDEKIATYLIQEMSFFNNLVRNTNGGSDSDGLDKSIGAGQTIKDSIEGLFKIPEWLKKILKVLNELLSIVKGI